jgi:hypothetical protein
MRAVPEGQPKKDHCLQLLWCDASQATCSYPLDFIVHFEKINVLEQ